MLENIEELPVEIGSETSQCKEVSAFSFDFQQPAPSQSPPSTVQDSAVFLFDDSTILAYQGENVYNTNSGEKSTSRTRSGSHAHGAEQVPSGCDDCPARIWDSFEEEVNVALMSTCFKGCLSSLGSLSSIVHKPKRCSVEQGTREFDVRITETTYVLMLSRVLHGFVCMCVCVCECV